MALHISEAGIEAMAKAHHDTMRDNAEIYLGALIPWEKLSEKNKEIYRDAMRIATEAL